MWHSFPQRHPRHVCRARARYGEQHVGSVVGEAFAADAARSQYEVLLVPDSVETDRGDDSAFAPERGAVRLDLVAQFDAGVDSVGARACDDAAVVQQHRCSASRRAIRETLCDESATRIDESVQRSVHARMLSCTGKRAVRRALGDTACCGVSAMARSVSVVVASATPGVDARLDPETCAEGMHIAVCIKRVAE